MCQRAPGKRCSSHVVKKMASAKTKLDNAIRSGSNEQKEAAERKMRNATDSYHETTDGLNSLQKDNNPEYHKFKVRSCARSRASKAERAIRAGGVAQSNQNGTRMSTATLGDGVFITKCEDSHKVIYSVSDNEGYVTKTSFNKSNNTFINVSVSDANKTTYQFNPDNGLITSNKGTHKIVGDGYNIPKAIKERFFTPNIKSRT